jgi:hypothetical protein
MGRGPWTALGAAALLVTSGCSLGKEGLGPNPSDAAAADVADAKGVADASGDDVSPPDGGGDDATTACVLDQCVGACCAGCATGGIFCPSAGGPGGTCVASCAACAASGGPTSATCYTCTAAVTLFARCESSPSACPADLDAGACPCPTGTPEQCPGPRQSCVVVDGQYVCLSD